MYNWNYALLGATIWNNAFLVFHFPLLSRTATGPHSELALQINTESKLEITKFQ